MRTKHLTIFVAVLASLAAAPVVYSPCLLYTSINRMSGSATDGKSMIWPMKVFRGSQPYDPVNKTLVTPHTAGNDDTGYWKNLDWDKAITVGMKDSGHPYSGKMEFLKTCLLYTSRCV